MDNIYVWAADWIDQWISNIEFWNMEVLSIMKEITRYIGKLNFEQTNK